MHTITKQGAKYTAAGYISDVVAPCLVPDRALLPLGVTELETYNRHRLRAVSMR
jgi:hypothetical protein